jgi:hypothetical protein
MVDQLTFQTIGILLTALTVSIAAIYYTLTLRYTRRNQDLQLETRQAQLYMGLNNTFTSLEFRKQWHITETATWKDYDDFNDKYGPDKNLEVLTATTMVFAFFDSVGALVRKQLIDIDLVDGVMAISLIVTWRMFESVLKGDREFFNSPTLWGDFEYIYNELNKREQYAHTKSPYRI